MGKKALNVNGTEGGYCGCGNWLVHWERVCGRKARFCSEVNCSGPAAAGALVMKDGNGDGRWYIIPLCHDHHGMTGRELEVAESTTFVPAEARETCGLAPAVQ
jgi:hypothetical protein